MSLLFGIFVLINLGGLMKRDLTGIKYLSKEDILHILSMAKDEKPKVKDKTLRDNHLKSTSLVTLFYENSTRTKISFLLAGEYLGAYTDDLNINTSSVTKGETLIDTCLTLDSMGTNVIVVRHAMTGVPHFISNYVCASVINGGDGINEHPTQALLDLFTIQQHKGGFKGLNVSIVGDIMNSRVARSNIFGLVKLGANVTVAGSSTLVSSYLQALGANVTTNVKSAVKNADVIMGLRIQLERQKALSFPSLSEYAKFFGIDKEMLSHAKSDTLIMHPGPVNRGVEFSTAVIDSEQSAIYEQVGNGIAVRMAVLKYLLY